MPNGEEGHMHIFFVCIHNIYIKYIFKHIYIWTKASKPMQPPHHKGYFLGETALGYPCPLLCPPYGHIPSPQALPFVCCIKSLHAVSLACRQHCGEGLGGADLPLHNCLCPQHQMPSPSSRGVLLQGKQQEQQKLANNKLGFSPRKHLEITTRGKDARKFLVNSDMAADLD